VALVVVAATAASAWTSTAAGASAASRTAAATRSAEAPAVGLGAGFVDVECASAKFFPVQSSDSLFGFASLGHFYKGKSARASGVTVGDQTHLIDFAMRFEQRTEFRFGGAVREVANKKFLHGILFL
jgi:hypothetical protein